MSLESLFSRKSWTEGWILMILARSTKNYPLHLLEHSQGCWAGHHPCLEFVQWTLSWGKPIWGFTPVCTVAKGLEVALASQHLSMSQNYQTQTFTSTETSWLIIMSQCYIKWVSAESVCCSSHLRMDSDSVSVNFLILIFQTFIFFYFHF